MTNAERKLLLDLAADARDRAPNHGEFVDWCRAMEAAQGVKPPLLADAVKTAESVPREPTSLMLHKGLEAYSAAYAEHLSGAAIVGQVWRAMHDAATGTTVSESRDDG